MKKLYLKKQGAGYLGAVLASGHLVDAVIFGPTLPFSRVGQVLSGRVLKNAPQKNTYFVESEGMPPALVKAVEGESLTEGQGCLFRVTHDLNLKELHKGVKGSVVKEGDPDQADWFNHFFQKRFSGCQVICQDAALTRMIQERFPDYDVSYTLEDVFNSAGIEDAWHALFESEVLLEGGGSLTFEETHVGICVDVNQSSSALASRSSIKKVNKAALNALVDHVKLRNLVGLILVDFIDFDRRQDAAFFLEEVKKSLAAIGGMVLGYTRGGLIEITRPRIGFPLHILRDQLKDIS